MPAMSLSLLLVLDLAGTVVFALSGALLAIRKDFDIVGVAVLSVAAGLGGGITRDVLLGIVPPAGLRDERYLLSALAAALIGFCFHPRIERLSASIRLFDALGLAVFAASGTVTSLDADLGALTAVLLGVVTGVGGGVIRDILALEVPLVLRRDVYALAALVGAALVAALVDRGIADSVAAVAGATATFVLRILAMRFNWQAPRPRR